VPRESELGDEAALDIVYMGTPTFAAVCLRSLLTSRHRVVAVVTQPDKPAGRGMQLRESPVKVLAREHGIAVEQPSRVRDDSFADGLRSSHADLAVVVAYGRILPKRVIETPRLGCINAHASLLPKLRGAAPIQRAIMEGFDETGVTIMCIDEAMDAGDMLLSQSVAIDGDTDAAGLHDALAATAGPLLVEAVDALAAGRAKPIPQEHSAASYAPPIGSADTRIDWSRTAAQIDRQIRALRPRPGAFTNDGGTRLKVLAARPAGKTGDAPPGTLLGPGDEGIHVACANGILTVVDVQPEGRKAMNAVAYLRGRNLPLPRRFDVTI
jgi:methionyl-tRNA formyltransferase